MSVNAARELPILELLRVLDGKLREEYSRVQEISHPSPAQVALAWILAQGDKIIPIPGTSKVEVRCITDCVDWLGN